MWIRAGGNVGSLGLALGAQTSALSPSCTFEKGPSDCLGLMYDDHDWLRERDVR